MPEAYIVDAVRSPIGKFLGEFSGVSATRLGAYVLKGMLRRTEIDPRKVDEVIVGNVITAGEGQNPAKQVVIYSGMPDTTPAFSVNKVCASSLKAIGLAAESINAGNADLVFAGGVESMSNAPFTIKGIRKYHKLGDVTLQDLLNKMKEGMASPSELTLVDEVVNGGLFDCYNDLHMGALAERLSGDYSVTREEQDAFALESHRRAAEATDKGKFKDEIIPIRMSEEKTVSVDEGIRRDSSMEKLASLKSAFQSNGTVTAGNSSQLSDGASFLAVASEKHVDEHGLKPIARIEAYAASGTDPALYGIAPVEAVNKVLKRTGLKLSDVDLIELNEAFCVQTLAVVKALGIDMSKLNVNGGATALGHPIGASGARITTTLVHALKDRQKNIGLATLCHGGGGAAAMIVRRV
jgi:acetyl-CoA C-acetyltransferase